MGEQRRQTNGQFDFSPGSGKSQIPRPADDLPHLRPQWDAPENPYGQMQTAPAGSPPLPPNDYSSEYSVFTAAMNENGKDPSAADALKPGDDGWHLPSDYLPNISTATDDSNDDDDDDDDDGRCRTDGCDGDPDCGDSYNGYCPACADRLYADDNEPDGMSDVEADADTLAGAGWGTDEDYGSYGGDDF
jgi:hypothetical protein